MMINAATLMIFATKCLVWSLVMLVVFQSVSLMRLGGLARHKGMLGSIWWKMVVLLGSVNSGMIGSVVVGMPSGQRGTAIVNHSFQTNENQ